MSTPTRNDSRERLRRSVDELAERANLYAQMQQDPLRIIGGASGVGLLLGLLVGSRVKRTRKIYVDATSSLKDQKAFVKAQQRATASTSAKKGGLSGAVVAAVVTIGIRVLQDRVLRPQLEQMADRFLEKAKAAQNAPRPAPGAERHG